MDIISKGFSSILIIVLVFLAASFLINILPLLLVIGAGVWGLSFVYRKAAAYFKSKKSVFTSRNEKPEVVDNMNLTESNIIDVEYTEVK